MEALAGYGVPEAEIAGVVEVDPKTLRKHYRRELDHGHVKANARVAENLYRKATGEGREAVTAAIFWLKTRAGWRELSSFDAAAKPGDPTTVVIMRWGNPVATETDQSAQQKPCELGPLIQHANSRH